jgi:hypothetical protein
MFYPIPPVAASGDADYASVKLLLPMDGSDNGTTFTESSSSPITITRAGTPAPVTKTGVKKFGTASALFGANTAGNAVSQLRCTIPAIGTNPFTIEGWVYLTSNATSFFVFSNNANSGYTAALNDTTAFYFSYSSVSNAVRFQYYTPTTTSIAGTTQFSNNTWYHIAASRDSSNLVRLFVNGTQEASETINHNFSNPYAIIGAFAATTSATPDRYLDDFRLTIGVCRYTENFTPPTEAYPTSQGTAAIQFPASPIVAVHDTSRWMTRVG